MINIQRSKRRGHATRMRRSVPWPADGWPDACRLTGRDWFIGGPTVDQSFSSVPWIAANGRRCGAKVRAYWSVAMTTTVIGSRSKVSHTIRCACRPSGDCQPNSVDRHLSPRLVACRYLASALDDQVLYAHKALRYSTLVVVFFVVHKVKRERESRCDRLLTWILMF